MGRLVTIILTLIAIPLIARFLSSSTNDLQGAARVIRIGWWVTAGLVVVQLVIFLFQLLRLRSTIYTVTNQRVMIETGLFTKTLNEIDLRYIDDSQFFQGVIDRMLGIGNVTLVSSDKTSPVSVLRGIRDPRGIREMVRANAYQVSQRQLFTRAT